jgi:hypothetical protein
MRPFAALVRSRHEAYVDPKGPARSPVHRFIDSTGTKALDEKGWSMRRHSEARPATWCKTQLAINAQTQGVEGELVKATMWAIIPCSPRCPRRCHPSTPSTLLSQKGVYSTRTCHTAIAVRQARAVTPVPHRPPPVGEHVESPGQEPRSATTSCEKAVASAERSGGPGAALPTTSQRKRGP